MSAAEFPRDNALASARDGAYFSHCASIVLPTRPASALEVYRALTALSPSWLQLLMSLRNRGMRLLGMKDLGPITRTFDAYEPQPGERAGIFTVLSSAPDQLVLGDRDRHLSVSLSLQLRDEAPGTRLYCATVVEQPTRFGRVYMLPVDPIHRIVVPLMLQRYARQLYEREAAVDGPNAPPPRNPV